MRVLLFSVGLMALAGCFGGAELPAPEVEAEPVFVPQGDTCGAGQLSNLMGASKATVEGMSFDQPVRIIEAGSPVTTDFLESRINFLIVDGEVAQITCG